MKLRALAAVFTLAATLPLMAGSSDWDRDKVQGPVSAPVVIEIFSSFDCPHCRILHEGMMPQILKDLVTPGKVCVVNREFPLTGPGHVYAREAALIATAAARIHKYQPVAGALFRTQETWAMNGKLWESLGNTLTAAELAQVKKLVGDAAVIAEVEKDYQQASAAGVNQTPTLMVIRQRDGKRYPFAGVPPNYELFRDFLLNDVK